MSLPPSTRVTFFPMHQLLEQISAFSIFSWLFCCVFHSVISVILPSWILDSTLLHSIEMLLLLDLSVNCFLVGYDLCQKLPLAFQTLFHLLISIFLCTMLKSAGYLNTTVRYGAEVRLYLFFFWLGSTRVAWLVSNPSLISSLLPVTPTKSVLLDVKIHYFVILYCLNPNLRSIVLL